MAAWLFDVSESEIDQYFFMLLFTILEKKNQFITTSALLQRFIHYIEDLPFRHKQMRDCELFAT